MDKQKIVSALKATWQAIGPDILQSAEEDSIGQDEVIEVVCDCDNPITFGRLTRQEWDNFNKEPDHIRIPILLEAFPFERYGW